MGFIGNATALGLGTIGGILTIAITTARIVITMMKTVTAIVVGAITTSGIGERAVEWYDEKRLASLTPRHGMKAAPGAVGDLHPRVVPHIALKRSIASSVEILRAAKKEPPRLAWRRGSVEVWQPLLVACGELAIECMTGRAGALEQRRLVRVGVHSGRNRATSPPATQKRPTKWQPTGIVEG
jgi:hypothetical protein